MRKKIIFEEKQEKKDCALTIRIKPSTLAKLKKLQQKYKRSQSEIIEMLIDYGYEELSQKEKKD